MCRYVHMYPTGTSGSKLCFFISLPSNSPLLRGVKQKLFTKLVHREHWTIGLLSVEKLSFEKNS